ncbi:MAG TPA: GAF domain-containing protein, partial [Candidatus Methylomirabilis sp.]|nr:GAF domain-containing protein [Candidatus Methylomirabilis sp.]
ALAFALAGASLGVLGKQQRGARLRRLAEASAGIVALIGGLTLIEYLLGWDLGIDQTLFREPPEAIGTGAPGRMAPTTALNFLLHGAALLLLDRPEGMRVSQAFTLTAGAIGLLNLLGYAYSIPALYGLPNATDMAVHAAAAFLVLSLGLLCARPEGRLMAPLTSPNVGGVMARRLLLPATGGLLLLGWFTVLGEKAHLYDTGTGTALLVLASVSLVALLGWRYAGALNRMEAERRRTQADLDKAYIEVEAQVEDRTADLVTATDALRKEIAQRKGREEVLQASEAQWRLLFDSNPHPMWLVDHETLAFLAVNDAAVLHYGFSRDEFLAMTIKDIRPPEDVSALLGHFETVVNEAVASGQELVPAGVWRHRKKDGTLMDVEITWSPLVFRGRDASLVLATDITHRKRAEEALQRAHRDEERRRQEAEGFATLMKELATSLELDHVLARIVDQAKLLGQGDLAFLVLAEANGQALAVRAHTGAVSATLPGLMLPRGRGMAGKALETGTPQVTDRLLEDPLFSHDFDPVARAEGTVTQVAVPITHEGRPLGVLLAARRTPRPFTMGDIQLLTRLADAASLACHDALLYQQATSRAAALERLWQVGQALLHPLSLPETLKRIAQAASELLHTEHAVLTLWDEAAQLLTTAARIGGEDQQLLREFRLGKGVHGTVAATRRPLLVNNYAAFPARVQELSTILTATVVAPLLIEGRLIGTLGVYATTPARTFTAEDLRLLELLAQPAASALENARLHGAAVRRGEELGAVLRATQTVMAGLDLQVILERIVGEASVIVGLPYVTAFLVDQKARALRPGAAAGAALPQGFRIRLGESFSGTVAATGKPLFVPDARNDPRKILAEQERGFEFVSYLGVPIKVRDEVVGVLAFYSTTPWHSAPEELPYLSSFADQAAIALENARLFEQVRAGRERLRAVSRRLVDVQEAKSRELARELHDQIGQILTGLQLTLEMSARLPARESKTRIGEAQATVHDLLTRIRELSLDLRPAMLDDLGLLPALLWHFERYTAQTRVQVALKHSGLEGRRFPQDIETAAYRIVQEALTNVARHAGVNEVAVKLWADRDTLGVRVEDQGKGFEPEAVLASHTTSGLVGMRERASLLGGHLTAESRPGTGTRVIAELPLGEPVERRRQERGG